MTIDNASKGLSPEEINRMVAEAEMFKAEDEARVAQQEARSEYEQFLSVVQERATDTGDRDLKDKIGMWREWLDDNEKATRAEIERRLESMQREVGYRR